MSKKILLLFFTHAAVGLVGFVAGIYLLPILTAPPAPDTATVTLVAEQSQFKANFERDLEDSDAFHWGEGEVTIGPEHITFMGKLSPGPDYKLYLSPEFVETEDDFERLKADMLQVGEVKTFENFLVKLGPEVNPQNYNSVIVWCESFGEFITAAKYQE